jgi:hypothetical protein
MRDKQSLHETISTTNTSRIWTIVLLICFFAGPALESSVSAGVVVDITQSGGNVVATALPGSLDTASLVFVGDFPPNFGVEPSIAGLTVGSPAPTAVPVYNGISGPTSFGDGPLTLATTSTGDVISLNGSLGALGVPVGYVSGSPLTGSTATWDNTNIAKLGLEHRDFHLHLGNWPDGRLFHG